MKSWYAVYTKPRRETEAETHLGRQAFDTYLPRIAVNRRRSGRWQQVIEPLFPRYLFICIDPETDSISPVRSTRGVIDMVRFGNRLIPVPDELIQFIMANESPESGCQLEHDALFNIGDKITLSDGPMAGLDGIYQASKGEDRALILVSLMGRMNPMTVSIDSVIHANT